MIKNSNKSAVVGGETNITEDAQNVNVDGEANISTEDAQSVTLGGEANISTEDVQNEALNLTTPSKDSQKLESDFPIDAIPETIRGILIEYHNVHQLPLDYFGLTMLTLAGGIMGNTFKLKYKYLCLSLIHI